MTLSFALCSAAALAQPQRIEVSATRWAQPIERALAHTTVITRDDIERSQLADLAALLASEAGVQLASHGGLGAPTSLFLRGARSSQVLLLVDGVPMTRQDASGSLPLEHLLLDQVERVEIVRGNVSAVYGSGAIGGVVQVFTRRGAAPSASVEIGSRGLRRASVGVAGGQGASTWSVALSGLHGDGFSALDPQRVATANPDRDGYQQTALSASLSHAFAPAHRAGLRVTATRARADYDHAFATPADVQHSRSALSSWTAWSEHHWSPAWRSEIALSSTNDDARFQESGAFGSQSQYQTQRQRAQWINRLDAGDWGRVTLGAERERQRLTSDDGFTSALARTRDVDALLAGWQGGVGAHLWQMNLRHDRVGAGSGQSSAYLGWGLALGSQWSLRASASNAYQAPPLGYLYAPFFGNADLQVESARSVEAGLQWRSGGHWLRATWHDTRLRNEFQYDFARSRFENLARTRNRGLELSASGEVGATTWRASLTGQDPIDELTGSQLLRRSRLLASAGLTHDRGAWRWGLNLRHVGARPEVGATRLSAYSLLDLSVERRLHVDGLSWTARIDNLADARYETAAGYAQPSRGLFVGLRWRGAR